MRVELLYFDGCPNWAVTDERLAEALRICGRDDIVVERHRVETAEQAEDLGFLGSPTVRFDTDPFASSDARVGLACHVYTGPHGLSGAPTIAQLLQVLS